MTTIINNGIFSNGNGNTIFCSSNSSNIYNSIQNELAILEQYTDEDLHILKEACERKNSSLLQRGLKALKKETLDLIITLGLQTIQNLIKNLF